MGILLESSLINYHTMDVEQNLAIIGVIRA